MRVIADHMRASVFLWRGVRPENTGRGYVLRRILRRAARHGKMLGLDEPFLCRLVDAVLQVMGTAYPELNQQADYIARILLARRSAFCIPFTRGCESWTPCLNSTAPTAAGASPARKPSASTTPSASHRSGHRSRRGTGHELDREAFEATLENTANGPGRPGRGRAKCWWRGVPERAATGRRLRFSRLRSRSHDQPGGRHHRGPAIDTRGIARPGNRTGVRAHAVLRGGRGSDWRQRYRRGA